MIATAFVVNFIIEQLKDVAVDKITEHLTDLCLEIDDHVIVLTSSPRGLVDILLNHQVTDFTIDCDDLKTVVSFRCSSNEVMKTITSELKVSKHKFKVIK